jgi:hypothetical protein
MMYGIAAPSPYFSTYLHLGPFGLFASPGWDSSIEVGTLRRILRFLTRPRVRGFTWTVRYDHVDLAAGLEALGLRGTTSATHVIDLVGGYSAVATGYSATIRNQIGKAHRRGVSVRHARDEADVRSYYEIHRRLVEQRDWRGFRYPFDLLHELSRLGTFGRLLLAEHEGQLIAGGLFFLDGDSVLYWHGASDRQHSERFASRAVMDAAIRWACDVGATSFNLGSSAGIASIESFKSMWGAQSEVNKTFEWTSPLWRRLATVKDRLGGYLR